MLLNNDKIDNQLYIDPYNSMLNTEIRKLIPENQCLFYDSAWVGHGPFAMWLAITFKPKSIVELGSHGGYSYFAFCQAVQNYNIESKCYAIDTWEGDDHASFYDNSIYQNVKKINDEKYSSFSSLVRKRFDQAVNDFPDKSIDLLHIDGRHGYEDVKYDFECYIPKLSDNAIVVFHDVKAYKPGFGVYKYFDELSKQYLTTTFEHSSGLGILFYGKNLNSPNNIYSNIIKDLCNKKSVLYNTLYMTGITTKSHLKLARLKHNSSNNKTDQLEIYQYAKKIYFKEIKSFFKLLKIKIYNRYNKLFTTQS